MSFWWYTRGKSGKRILWQVDTDPTAILSIAGLIATIISVYLLAHPTLALSVPFVLVLGGLACLIVAKISLYRQGIWFSFGCGLMSRRHAILYKAAYLLMGLGVLLMLLAFNGLRIVA
jgi:hypothetical protein